MQGQGRASNAWIDGGIGSVAERGYGFTIVIRLWSCASRSDRFWRNGEQAVVSRCLTGHGVL